MQQVHDQAPAAPDSSRPTHLDGPLIAALAGNFFLRLGNAATGLMLTRYLNFLNNNEFPIDAAIVGLFSTVFYATELFLAPFCGAKSDRSGRRLFLLLGPILGFIAVLLTAAAPAVAGTGFGRLFDALAGIMPAVLWILLSTRVIEGLSSAASIPAILSYLSARTEHDRPFRGWVMGLFEALTSIAILGGSMVGVVLFGQFNVLAFAFLGIPYLISVWLFRQVSDEPTTSHREHRDLHESVMALARQPAIGRFVPAWLAVNAVVGLWYAHAVYQLGVNDPPGGQYLVGRFVSDQNGLLVVLGGYAILFAIGSMLWTRAFSVFSEPAIMRMSLIGLFVGCIAAWVTNHSGDNEMLRAVAVTIMIVAVVVQSGFLPAAVGYLARLSSLVAADRGLVMGVYNVMLGGGQLLGGAIGVPFVKGDIPFVGARIDGVIALTAILGLISFAVVLLLGEGEADPEPVSDLVYTPEPAGR